MAWDDVSGVTVHRELCAWSGRACEGSVHARSSHRTSNIPTRTHTYARSVIIGWMHCVAGTADGSRILRAFGVHILTAAAGYEVASGSLALNPWHDAINTTREVEDRSSCIIYCMHLTARQGCMYWLLQQCLTLIEVAHEATASYFKRFVLAFLNPVFRLLSGNMKAIKVPAADTRCAAGRLTLRLECVYTQWPQLQLEASVGYATTVNVPFNGKLPEDGPTHTVKLPGSTTRL